MMVEQRVDATLEEAVAEPAAFPPGRAGPLHIGAWPSSAGRTMTIDDRAKTLDPYVKGAA